MIKRYSLSARKVTIPVKWEDIKLDAAKADNKPYELIDFSLKEDVEEIISYVFNKDSVFYCTDEDVDYKDIITDYTLSGDECVNTDYLKVFLGALLDGGVYLLRNIKVDTHKKRMTLSIYSVGSNEHIVMDILGALQSFARNIIIDEIINEI